MTWICNKCKEEKHKCVISCGCKAYEIIDEDGNKQKIYANGPGTAAEKFVQNRGIKINPVEITVDGKPYKINTEINYYANELCGSYIRE